MADLDGDGPQEVIAGKTVFEANGQIRWTSDAPDGFCAVADVFASEPGKEVVLTSNGYVRVLRSTDGETLWTRELEGWEAIAAGGPPSVADYDGDGEVEFAIAHSRALGIYDHRAPINALPQPSENSHNPPRAAGIATVFAGPARRRARTKAPLETEASISTSTPSSTLCGTMSRTCP